MKCDTYPFVDVVQVVNGLPHFAVDSGVVDAEIAQPEGVGGLVLVLNVLQLETDDSEFLEGPTVAVSDLRVAHQLPGQHCVSVAEDDPVLDGGYLVAA